MAYRNGFGFLWRRISAMAVENCIRAERPHVNTHSISGLDMVTSKPDWPLTLVPKR